ncbi:transposase [Streptomyces sp. NPDC006510]|uniref:transposase n=1 Tax=Streptomyces sp. NPDC006510 TaxID=3155600 RepID=UPI0033B8755C
MGMKHYPAEFKADAVALYRSRPGATIKSVATDLGVNRVTARLLRRSRCGVGAGATPAFPARPAIPDRLREHLPNNINYPDPNRIDVFKIRGQGPQLPGRPSAQLADSHRHVGMQHRPRTGSVLRGRCVVVTLSGSPWL